MVSITAMHTDSTAQNVIADSVLLRGTVRTHDPEVQDLAEERLRRIVTQTAAAYGAEAEIDYFRNYPVTVNHETETDYAVEAARRVSDNVRTDAPLIMGGEDFSFMSNARPGAYILVGNGDSAQVHNPNYNFNDDAIPAGCSWYVEMAESRMPLG